MLADQANDLVDFIKNNKPDLTLSTLDNIYRFFIANEIVENKLNPIKDKLYCLYISVTNTDEVTINLSKLSNNKTARINFDTNALYKLVVKCLKIFITSMGRGSGDEKIFQLFEEKKHPGFFDEEFIHNFEKEFTFIFEKEFPNIFEQEFYHSIEKEYSNKLEMEYLHRFEDFSLKFEKELFHSSKDKMHRFDREFSHKFENEFFHRFENEFHVFDRSFGQSINAFDRYLEKSKDNHIFKKNFPTFKNNYERYLFGIVISSISSYRRRKRGFSIFDVYMRLNYFYYILSNIIKIKDVEDFKIVF